MRGRSLVAASRGHSSSRCAGLSLSWPLLLRGTGSRRAGSVVVAHGPSCSAACGIFPDQGSKPRTLHWQADSQPLPHQGSPIWCTLNLPDILYLLVHRCDRDSYLNTKDSCFSSTCTTLSGSSCPGLYFPASLFLGRSIWLVLTNAVWAQGCISLSGRDGKTSGC